MDDDIVRGSYLERYPWDRTDDERSAAFHYFQYYLRDAPRPRKYSDVAKEMGVTLGNIEAIGARHNWHERARLYDQWMDRRKDENRMNAIDGFQDEVTYDGVKDYRSLRSSWEQLHDQLSQDIEKAAADGDTDRLAALSLALNRMISARVRLDTQARRSAQLPMTYKDGKTMRDKEVDQTSWVVTPGGTLPDGTDS